ncbi:MAG: AraC family transcriptional regulator [Terriglobales bacterium]
MDSITDIFQSLRIVSVVQARLEATAPWGLKRAADATASDGKPSDSCAASQFAHFGVVSRGSCWLRVDGMPDAMPLAGGDCFLLAPGSSYSLRDNPRTRAASFCSVLPQDGSQTVHYGGGGAPTTIISGWFRFGAASLQSLARWLPPLILVKAEQPQTLALRTTMNMLAAEMADPAPGSGLLVDRLADILFVQCLRAHIASAGCNNGLLRACFDPQIGTALKSMHAQVEAPWTVESLAAASGMSRSGFALRFKRLVGETPLEYLTTWRMQKAVVLLQTGGAKMREVAASVGYNSDAAFSKAFKRVVRVAPRQFRKNATQSGSGAFDSPADGVA